MICHITPQWIDTANLPLVTSQKTEDPFTLQFLGCLRRKLTIMRESVKIFGCQSKMTAPRWHCERHVDWQLIWRFGEPKTAWDKTLIVTDWRPNPHIVTAAMIYIHKPTDQNDTKWHRIHQQTWYILRAFLWIKHMSGTNGWHTLVMFFLLS